MTRSELPRLAGRVPLLLSKLQRRNTLAMHHNQLHSGWQPPRYHSAGMPNKSSHKYMSTNFDYEKGKALVNRLIAQAISIEIRPHVDAACRFFERCVAVGSKGALKVEWQPFNICLRPTQQSWWQRNLYRGTEGLPKEENIWDTYRLDQIVTGVVFLVPCSFMMTTGMVKALLAPNKPNPLRHVPGPDWRVSEWVPEEGTTISDYTACSRAKVEEGDSHLWDEAEPTETVPDALVAPPAPAAPAPAPPPDPVPPPPIKPPLPQVVVEVKAVAKTEERAAVVKMEDARSGEEPKLVPAVPKPQEEIKQIEEEYGVCVGCAGNCPGGVCEDQGKTATA